MVRERKEKQISKKKTTLRTEEQTVFKCRAALEVDRGTKSQRV